MTEQSGGHSGVAKRTALIAGAIALAALVVGFAGGFFSGRAIGSSPQPVSTGTAAGVGGSCDAIRVADAVLPTIVTISVQGAGGNGVGSGEVVRSNGYIVTNNHVISAAATGGRISVTFSGGSSLDAKLVGRDPASDLAVLKVDAGQPLPVIGLANSDHVVVGQPVVALGAPLGLNSTVTAGIVSALERNVPVPSDNNTTTTLAGAIQTDAAINPGNSGGALVDCDGHLIGVNTAIATVPNAEGTAGGGSVGIGFAVPTNLATDVVKQLITSGHVAYPYFGAQVVPIPPEAAHRFNVEDGLYVQAVTAGGPADQAGLEPGDVITKIDGAASTNTAVLTRVTLTKRPGDVITLTYVRGTTTKTTKMTLGSQP